MMNDELRTRIAGNWREILNAVGDRNVKIIAVSKTHPAAKLRDAYEAGVRVFGENRIQEAIPKIQDLESWPLEWHFIGHLQTNKSRDAVRFFSWIHSIDSIKLLHQVEKEAMKQSKQINLLLEINLGGEESKSGTTEMNLPELLQAGKDLTWSHIRGLMTIPPFLEDVEKVRPYFQRLRELRNQYLPVYPKLTELSMGMSHDYVAAIEEGATMVRIGTALFGERVTSGERMI